MQNIKNFEISENYSVPESIIFWWVLGFKKFQIKIIRKGNIIPARLSRKSQKKKVGKSHRSFNMRLCFRS
jgi:hypothetical protein